jgi:hypothetical protein
MNQGQVRRSNQGSRKKRRTAGAITILAVLGLTVVFLYVYPFSEQKIPFPLASTPSYGSPNTVNYWDGSLSGEPNTAQTVLPYSVIPGGAHSSKELLEAVQREPVVAAHYAEFRTDHVRVIHLKQDKLAYVSYRLGNQIYWTKKKLMLHEGETLLSDGEHLARTRCGNRVSDVPMTPVAPDEPAEKTLNTPIMPPHVDMATVSLLDGPLWPEISAAPALLPMSGLPPATGSTPGGLFPPFIPIIPIFCCSGGGSPPPSSSSSPSSPSTPSTPVYPLPQPGCPVAPPTATPEPTTLLLLLLGLAFAAFLAHSRTR